ncbi:MAG: hypothetical protein FWH27_16510 [Planctomycetaceae bacterium]|nr:hypothetical protein [Planctomycetaceae bacterium]
MPSKHIIIISIIVLLGNLSLLFAQQPPNTSEENKQFVYRGRLYYINRHYDTIDDWEDVPLVQYSVSGMHRKGLPPMEVMIWQDGRIAWKDRSKVGDAYFKMQLTEDEVNIFIEKITSRYNSSPLKRYPLRANDYTGFLSVQNPFTVVVNASICSQHIVNMESWLLSLLETSCSLSDQIKTETPQVFIDSMKKHIDEKKYPIYHILSYYRELYGLNKSDPSTDKEIYLLMRQFADDGEFFMFLGKTIEELIPKDENLTSTNVQRITKFFTVTAHLDEEGNKVYTYEMRPDLPRKYDSEKEGDDVKSDH